MTRTSFISVVRHDRLPSTVLVRARIKNDITRIWPTADIVATPNADYGFRAAIAEADVSNALTRLVHEIDYTTDFKGGVREPARHRAYLSVWSVLARLQRPAKG